MCCNVFYPTGRGECAEGLQQRPAQHSAARRHHHRLPEAEAGGPQGKSGAGDAHRAHTVHVCRLISLTLHGGRSRNALWVNPFCWLRCLRQKVEKCSTFQAVTDPSANQVVSPLRPTHALSSVDGHVQCERGVGPPLGGAGDGRRSLQGPSRNHNGAGLLFWAEGLH